MRLHATVIAAVNDGYLTFSLHMRRRWDGAAFLRFSFMRSFLRRYFFLA
jgi:hypothetical protein